VHAGFVLIAPDVAAAMWALNQPEECRLFLNHSTLKPFKYPAHFNNSHTHQ